MGHWLPGNHRRSSKQQANRKCLKATFLYLIEAQLLENLVRMSTATTSEISGRIPELKTTTSVSSSLLPHQRGLELPPCWSPNTLFFAPFSPPLRHSSWLSLQDGSKAKRLGWEVAGGTQSEIQNIVILCI